MAKIVFREIRFDMAKEEIMVFFTDHEKIGYGVGCALRIGIGFQEFVSKLRALATCVESRSKQIIKELEGMPSPTIETGVADPEEKKPLVEPGFGVEGDGEIGFNTETGNFGIIPGAEIQAVAPPRTVKLPPRLLVQEEEE